MNLFTAILFFSIPFVFVFGCFTGALMRNISKDYPEYKNFKDEK